MTGLQRVILLEAVFSVPMVTAANYVSPSIEVGDILLYFSSLIC